MRALALACCLLASATFAQEDCALAAADLHPQFAAKLPAGFKLVSSKKDKRLLTEVLKTPTGFEVTLQLGGCAHVEYSLAITGNTLTPKTVGSELVAISRRVLPTLPMRKDATVNPALFLKAIDDANIAIVPTELPCGDATCRLSLEAAPVKEAKKPKPAKKPKKPARPEEEKPPAGLLKLSYDLAL